MFVLIVQLLRPSMLHSVKTTALIYFILLIRLYFLLSLVVYLPLLFPLLSLLLFLLLVPLPLLLLPKFLLLNHFFFFGCVALILSPIVTLLVLNLNLDHYLLCRCDRQSLK